MQQEYTYKEIVSNACEQYDKVRAAGGGMVATIAVSADGRVMDEHRVVTLPRDKMMADGSGVPLPDVQGQLIGCYLSMLLTEANGCLSALSGVDSEEVAAELQGWLQGFMERHGVPMAVLMGPQAMREVYADLVAKQGAAVQ